MNEYIIKKKKKRGKNGRNIKKVMPSYLRYIGPKINNPGEKCAGTKSWLKCQQISVYLFLSSENKTVLMSS